MELNITRKRAGLRAPVKNPMIIRGYPANSWALLVIITAIMSTLLTLVYTFLTGIRIFFGREQTGNAERAATDPPLTMSLPLLALAGVALGMGLYPQPFLTFLDSAIGLF